MKGNIVSEIYIKPDDLSGPNRIERICQKGFQIHPKTGMEFTLGQIDINPS